MAQKISDVTEWWWKQQKITHQPFYYLTTKRMMCPATKKRWIWWILPFDKIIVFIFMDLLYNLCNTNFYYYSYWMDEENTSSINYYVFIQLVEFFRLSVFQQYQKNFDYILIIISMTEWQCALYFDLHLVLKITLCRLIVC